MEVKQLKLADEEHTRWFGFEVDKDDCLYLIVQAFNIETPAAAPTPADAKFVSVSMMVNAKTAYGTPITSEAVVLAKAKAVTGIEL